MKQGEIWLINLDPTIGSEISKTRPAVLVNDNAVGRLPLKIIVPLTDWKDRYAVAPWMVNVLPDQANQLSKESAADCFQIRSVSQERLVRKVGTIGREKMREIRAALALVLSIP
ncbi:type II toxin-antitoxin system PemK/MazF family toxin [Hymenobacter lapidiphilus]|uniref:type II toxin-antitoxin system PemK/MazF family toxin n=1 Tax=Hymenobacter sp. CCM 8763 TaxID=2303334 RepID=UPI000E3414B8|nr:type II toxin-antitoxin system PemK/MazF family toxin [Hymenobacter sp. CCM 8763]RFP66424.1 type II toxin-antitoxin system PemK/MazF family toxin [Hymenobacter sp. CCM 8763]